ncbi:hypothetical protein FPSE_11912 [Fusarium pseudograminearum CS3096]|uniref:Uncharacterized protein n=1 Tax=Fusarium pseudograminearum (strain CS3096) TaxID=1028729 RepID=K3V7U8_FUSPC|nr:hypothetical protein FPSE_11912 [Fusarium pseudograminearum CS3096]EKJ67903.1 hypothetical protein FPSE_11912 [Fusarium pseudograminearum CS3096]
MAIFGNREFTNSMLLYCFLRYVTVIGLHH